MESHDLRMIHESRLYIPPESRARGTGTGTVAAFEQMLERSRSNPEGFWADVARELTWIRPWDRTMEGEFPYFRFFTGGIANPAFNMLDRHLPSDANRLALIWEGENFETRFYTYAMLLAEVNRFANVLKRLGIGKGDAVAVFTGNLAETVIAVLACYRLGALFNTIFSGFSTRALGERLAHYEPSLIITSDAAYRRGQALPLKQKVDEAIANLNSVKNVVVIRRTGQAVSMTPSRDHWWHDLMLDASPVCDPEPLEANEPGIVFYTSGTTGRPKGIVHSGMGFVVNNYVWTRYHMDHHPNDVLWCTADIGWLTMHIWGIVGALVNGVTTIFFEGALDWPKPERFYQMIEKYQVNKVFTAPTAVRMLMRYGDHVMSPFDLSGLDVVSVVGEPLNPEAWHWIYEKLGKKRIYVNNTWGQTELGGCPLAGAAWLTPMKPGSCSREFLGCNLDIVDDDGNPVPAHTPGNLIIRTPFPTMMRTLWKDPERYVSEYFSQVPGAYFTKDAAVKDADGHFWVIGRVDDVINVAGHRLSTMEMESAIMECEAVAEAAVVGEPHAIKGLVPAAFVIVRAGNTADRVLAAKIKAQVASSIGKIAIPERIYFPEALPKTASGKIMRRLLKEIVASGDVSSDVTSLEDVQSIQKVRDALERARQEP